MQIGPYQLSNKLILAPMAGISDRPFRELCKQFGASLAVSEMVASNPALREHKRTLLKADHDGDTGIRSVQILGTNPRQMADAALINVRRGADIIDINMGCPAKKVCSVAAGSALLKDEVLVRDILETVVNAVAVPVTLKIRTGWDLNHRNAVRIAKIAEDAGIAALTVHGRTRACKFDGQAEHETVKRVKQSVGIPVIANGDIDSPQTAKQVLDATGADAIMIGRAAQGNPWLFSQINHFLSTGKQLEKPDVAMIRNTLVSHLEKLYSFYGDIGGVRIARKHIGWYFKQLGGIPPHTKNTINQAHTPSEQLRQVYSAFDFLTHPL
ncbi:MAG: tRNA dihydrouridine synthase DusB [Methylovulum sp.]|nr:tRNA dihydrouridine synthase DusB [Methylovulum sp.]